MEVEVMLLTLLDRKEKLKFLDIAMHMVSVDGKPTEHEQRLLNMLLAEVGDDIVSEYTFTLSKDLEQTLRFFEKASPTIKNVLYLNLNKVAMSDDFYNTLEHEFLEMVRTRLEISEMKKKQLINLVFAERDLRERAKRIVSG